MHTSVYVSVRPAAWGGTLERVIDIEGRYLIVMFVCSYFEALGSTNPTKQDAIGEGN